MSNFVEFVGVFACFFFRPNTLSKPTVVFSKHTLVTLCFFQQSGCIMPQHIGDRWNRSRPQPDSRRKGNYVQVAKLRRENPDALELYDNFISVNDFTTQKEQVLPADPSLVMEHEDPNLFDDSDEPTSRENSGQLFQGWHDWRGLFDGRIREGKGTTSGEAYPELCNRR